MRLMPYLATTFSILCAILVLPALAGQVVVTRSNEHFDAFAVRDQVLKDYEWQESLRRQEQIQIRRCNHTVTFAVAKIIIVLTVISSRMCLSRLILQGKINT